MEPNKPIYDDPIWGRMRIIPFYPRWANEVFDLVPNVIINEAAKDPKPVYYDYDEDGMPILTK